MRAISRDIWEQINSVKRELDNLEALHILKSRLENKKKLFCVNRNFFLLDEFKAIFLKSYNPIGTLKKYFKDKNDLKLIIINESLSFRLIWKVNKVVDIFLIGEIDKIDFNDFLAKAFFNRKIKYAIIDKAQFFNRLEYNDKLILEILSQQWNISLKDEINVPKILEKLKA